MRALLDTHAFLWWVTNDPQLSPIVRELISNPDNTLYLSVVSAWEIIVKFNIGKLPLPEPPGQFIQSCLNSNNFEPLLIALPHVLQIEDLPDHHKDPFDRMLIAPAQAENMPILTIDRLIALYPAQTIW